MPAVQQWGRRESIIWPPRHYLYTLGAIFLALVATGFFIYFRFNLAFLPLDLIGPGISEPGGMLVFGRI
jgi:hypothetical protein